MIKAAELIPPNANNDPRRTKLTQLIQQWIATSHEGLFLIPGVGYRKARVVAQDGDVVVLAPSGESQVVLHYSQVVFRQ